ncbi:MAG: SurA N-terminal domain-containing protein [Actinomycetales bacterium]|nr:SurA N-terminal domain-containing protein [Actinomycetales bacterium]
MHKLTKVFTAFLATFLISGCSNSPLLSGSAASVGGQSIKQQVVTDQVKELENQFKTNPGQLSPPSAGELGQLVVNRLIYEKIISDSVSQLKIKISDSEVAQLRETIYGQYGEEPVIQQLAAKQGVPATQINSFFKMVLSQNYIGTTLEPKGSAEQQSAAASRYLANKANQSNIEISPRYGTWNIQQMIAAGSDNSLSMPASGSQ